MLVSSTRQWNPGDEFILLGVQNLLGEVLGGDVNWLLYNRNPDLYVSAWAEPTHRKGFWSNAFPCDDFAGLDLAVVAGTTGWLGKPMMSFYGLVREYAIPLVMLGVGCVDAAVTLSQDELYCFRELAEVIAVRDRFASATFSSLNVAHRLLPCPALFAARQEQFSTGVRKVAFILQTDKTLNKGVPTELKNASLAAAIDAARRKLDVEIVCFYRDEAAEFISKEVLPVRYSYNSYDYLATLRGYDVIVSTRLHGAILANSLGKPAVLLNRDPRCEGAAALFPFIFLSNPESVGARLEEIDIDAVNKQLPPWKAKIRQEYLDLLRCIDMADDRSTLRIRRFRSNMQTTLKAKNARIQELEAQVRQLEARLQQLDYSIPLQLAKRFQGALDRVAPAGTRRRRLCELILTGSRVMLNEGWGAFFRAVHGCCRTGRSDRTKARDE